MESQARHAFRRLRLSLPQPWARLLGEAAYAPVMLRSPETRRGFREEALIERLLASGRPLTDQGAGCSERVVEVPWVLRSLPRPAGRVLDVGTAFAPPVYHRQLVRLPAAERHGVDLAPFELPGVVSHRADARALPFADGAFDRVICISALEHMGLDNERYLGPDGAPRDESGDVTALREMGRVAGADGRVLVTVPGGRAHAFDWLRQYDAEAWSDLVAQAGLEIVRLDCFEQDLQRGWQACAPEALAAREYNGDAIGAGGLICAELRRA
ncbi:MAG TPA: class I SAM-dependent methyltransferase [Conexibacter sp.]|nr:class I SAM-dependent methyltransferase [Conexibacter sp.]